MQYERSEGYWNFGDGEFSYLLRKAFTDKLYSLMNREIETETESIARRENYRGGPLEAHLGLLVLFCLKTQEVATL